MQTDRVYRSALRQGQERHPLYQEGPLKSLLQLWQKVLEETSTWCRASTARDLKTVTSRVEHEGLSFLTITLPDFGKDFQKSLDLGQVDRDLFTGFQWRGGLPLFLGGYLDRVFDRGSGRLLDEPCIDSIRAIRQLTLMFAKILVPASEKRVRGAMSKFIECEREVRDADGRTCEQDLRDLHRMSALLFRDVFTEMDSLIYHGNIIPKHGPGATAERVKGNLKYAIRSWPARLERSFHYDYYALASRRHLVIDGFLDHVDFPEPGSETPVRVVPVPKTLKTPRVIAIEPSAMQYMQQGIMEQLVRLLETDGTVKQMIGFTDQQPNQLLAQEGSSTGELATLDLSEASDRVSNQHVRNLLQNFPHFNEAVDATRSRKADVPGYGVQRLAKFASMGSALCFPMEAMVFLTIVFLGIEREHNRQMTRKEIKSFAGRVRIYGDDIIVPVEYVRSVVGYLETFGFQVNAGKSYWNGKFRESCGKDYYGGHDVSLTRVRRVFPTQRSDVREIISLVSLRNQLYVAGYRDTCEWLDSRIRGLLPVFPKIQPSSPALGAWSDEGYDTDRHCPKLHEPLVRAYVVSARLPSSHLEGDAALLKWFLKRGDEPFADRNHLERHGRPDAVDIKLRWVSPV